MSFDDAILTAQMPDPGEGDDRPLGAVTAAIIDFLAHYGTKTLVGKRFAAVIGEGDGRSRLARLLQATGFEADPRAFARALLTRLAATNSTDVGPIAFNGVVLPPLLLYTVLETILPGDKFTSIKSVEQLDKVTNTRTPLAQRADLQKVLETYPVRLSSHTVRQMRVSRAVAYQYMPFVEELDPVGHVNTWIGQFHQGLLEQMYQNRVIFLLNMSCPVYCRFCFRKHKESRQQTNPSPADILEAVDYVRRSPTIKEIVITGGDPFMNRTNLACAIDGLKEISHVQTLRLATRAVAYYPQLFEAGNGALLKYVKAQNYELQMRGKRIEIATHFIHPDEISIQSLALITDFVNSGMPVYVQTPFLKDCNDQGPELTRLFGLLRGAGAELHYIYIPCSPIHGNSIYWTPLAKGLEVAHYLRAHLSDRIIPRICTATPIGKMDWHSSGWAVEPDVDNPHFLWIRTPYTPGYFKAFAPIANELDIVRVNAEGTIDARYMADIGDKSLFLGNRKPVAPKVLAAEPSALTELKERVLADQRIPLSMVATGTAGLFRSHATRVEIDLDNHDGDLTYVREQEAVSDVVLAGSGDAVENLHRIAQIVRALGEIDHVNAVRLRSFKFNYDPSCFTPAVIDRLGSLNRLTVVSPLRLEIETQFLHSAEIQPVHRLLAERLRNRGITVYSNTPLLADVNDAPDAIHRLAYQLRTAGIEFHHLVVAGLPLQAQWGRKQPVQVGHVIDIATRVRRDGSGREIPRYIIHTVLGEVDFGLTSKLGRLKGGLSVCLSPYNLAYYQRMQPDFSWPEGVTLDSDGAPVVPIAGLADSQGFMVFDRNEHAEKA